MFFFNFSRNAKWAKKICVNFLSVFSHMDFLCFLCVLKMINIYVSHIQCLMLQNKKLRYIKYIFIVFQDQIHFHFQFNFHKTFRDYSSWTIKLQNSCFRINGFNCSFWSNIASSVARNVRTNINCHSIGNKYA